VTEERPEDETAVLSEEAKADAAPVAEALPYRPLHRWRPGRCVGFTISPDMHPVKLKWPKAKKDKAEFFERINQRRA
jgi:hypothetical protein